MSVFLCSDQTQRYDVNIYSVMKRKWVVTLWDTGTPAPDAKWRATNFQDAWAQYLFCVRLILRRGGLDINSEHLRASPHPGLRA